MTKLDYQNPSPAPTTDPFTGDNVYVIRQKVFKFLGNAFHVSDSTGRVVLYSKQKAFKLREDIRLYTGEDMKTELISLKTAKIIDISANFQVVDTASGVTLGALRRKGLKSMIRDEWMIMNPAGVQVGRIIEESGLLAIVRRVFDWMQFIAPQSFLIDVNNVPVAKMTQNRNPFVRKLTLDFSNDPHHLLDRRLGIAAGVLLSAIEGRQG